MEGPAAPVGPQLPPDVLVSRELPGRPRACLHRPLYPPRRRRPRSVQRPRHHPAAGLRGGTDRSRQRPQPVRPHPDRRQSGPADEGGREDPTGVAAPGLGRLRRGVERARRSDRRQPGLGGDPCPGSRQQAARWFGTDHAGRARARRSRSGLQPSNARSGALPSSWTRSRRSGRSLPPRHADGHPPRQERQLPVHGHAEHLQHGPALRSRLRLQDGLPFARARRFLASGRQAAPPLSPARCRELAVSPCWATRATPGFDFARHSAPAACPSEPGLSLLRRRTCGL